MRRSTLSAVRHEPCLNAWPGQDHPSMHAFIINTHACCLRSNTAKMQWSLAEHLAHMSWRRMSPVFGLSAGWRPNKKQPRTRSNCVRELHGMGCPEGQGLSGTQLWQLKPSRYWDQIYCCSAQVLLHNMVRAPHCGLT